MMSADQTPHLRDEGAASCARAACFALALQHLGPPRRTAQILPRLRGRIWSRSYGGLSAR
jgi:hypothetical protein